VIHTEIVPKLDDEELKKEWGKIADVNGMYVSACKFLAATAFKHDDTIVTFQEPSMESLSREIAAAYSGISETGPSETFDQDEILDWNVTITLLSSKMTKVLTSQSNKQECLNTLMSFIRNDTIFRLSVQSPREATSTKHSLKDDNNWKTSE